MRGLKIYQTSLTDRSEDSLNRYLKEISQIDLLSPAEEVMLAAKIRKGDRAAEHRLITANLRFVISCAKKYRKAGMSLPDLVSEGNLGLIKAARMFDETRGFKFISYAVWWVRQAMLTSLNEHARMIRLPMNQQLAITEINKTAQELEQLLEREPTLEELSEATGKLPEKLKDCMVSASRMQYLQDPIPGSETQGNTMMGYLPDQDEDLTQSWIQHQHVSCGLGLALSCLSEREQAIISMAYGLKTRMPMDDESIGLRLKLSKERIRQLRNGAMSKLRERHGHRTVSHYA